MDLIYKEIEKMDIKELVMAVEVYEECYEESGNEQLLEKIYKLDEEIDKRYMEDEDVRMFIDEYEAMVKRNQPKQINIKYFNEDYPRLKKIKKGNWIDLYVDRIDQLRNAGDKSLETINKWFKEDGLEVKKGDVVIFGLGVAIELPEGYEAWLVPRSSTFGNAGSIQANGIGIIDTSFSGDNDEWLVQVIAMEDSKIERLDRLFQFRIIKEQPEIELNEVEHLGNPDRGGYGSTGKGAL